jgi:hypothetical protein
MWISSASSSCVVFSAASWRIIDSRNWWMTKSFCGSAWRAVSPASHAEVRLS